MGKQHNRRVFAGFYKRYDGKYIYVISVAEDADTGEAVIIYHFVDYSEKAKYFTITKKSFCEMVEVDGEYVDKFTRQTQMRISQARITMLEEDGFEGPKRKKPPKITPDEYSNRNYRRARTYEDYAKDICENYATDLRKYKLCIEQKKYIGVTKKDFSALKEDLTYLHSCLKTILKEYEKYFRERYLEHKSIRKYAYDHEMNRGSVEHLQKKFIAALASSLKQRDDSDGICRLCKYDYSE